ncbi:UDP-2,3-diacylglucosamine diphosphatase [Hydrogenimonas sp.]
MGSEGSGISGPFSASPGPSLLLKEGAWFIADAHYAHYHSELYDFLSSLSDGDLPPQMILMGDVFDLLFGYAPNSIEPNRKMVDLLKRMSFHTEIVYLEGNHDFGLKRVFGDSIRVVERSRQPLVARCGETRIALHHGDILQGRGYEIYTAWIRNPVVDTTLNLIDTATKGAIIGWLERYNRKKRPCYPIENFEELVKKRLEIVKKECLFDIWIEGHFHQNVHFGFGDVEYINLPAYACSRSHIMLKRTKKGLEFVEIKDRDEL